MRGLQRRQARKGVQRQRESVPRMCLCQHADQVRRMRHAAPREHVRRAELRQRKGCIKERPPSVPPVQGERLQPERYDLLRVRGMRTARALEIRPEGRAFLHRLRVHPCLLLRLLAVETWQRGRLDKG